MAKVAFSKLALKKQEEVKLVKIGNFDIEVKQYLPVNEKLDLVARVLNGAHDENNFPNPIKIEVIGTLEIIMAYTNISFTEKQKEDPMKLYDMLNASRVLNLIIGLVPEGEFYYLNKTVHEMANNIVAYRNSAMGIMERITTDYSNLDLDASAIQKELADPNNMTLLKDILTKLG